MKTILSLAILLLITVPAISQDLLTWRWADDEFYTDDKLVHAFGSQYLCRQIDKHTSLTTAVILTLSAGILWEVKDAYFPHEKIGWLGGDGFSAWDVWADFSGVFLYILSDYVIWPDRFNLCMSGNYVRFEVAL